MRTARGSLRPDRALVRQCRPTSYSGDYRRFYASEFISISYAEGRILGLSLGQMVNRALEMNYGLSVFERVKQFQRFTHERQGYRSVSNRLWHDFAICASEARSDTQAKSFSLRKRRRRNLTWLFEYLVSVLTTMPCLGRVAQACQPQQPRTCEGVTWSIWKTASSRGNRSDFTSPTQFP